MKTFIRIVAILLCSYPQIISAQDYRGAIRFEVLEFVERGDSLYVRIDVNISKSAVEKSAGMRLTPELIWEDQTLTMRDLMIQGKNKSKSYERSLKLLGKKQREAYIVPYELIQVDKNTNYTYKYEYTTPYQRWMDNAKLTIVQESIGMRDERSLFIVSLSNKVESAYKTAYRMQPRTAFITPEQGNKNRRITKTAFIEFEPNRSVIQPHYRNNSKELSEMKRAFDELKSARTSNATKLTITAYSPPEGTFESNNQLSRNRVFAVRDHLIRQFNIPIHPTNIHVAWVPEDWVGLRKLVASSDIQNKYDILAIIDKSASDPTESKKRLMNLAGGAPYKIIVRDIFPKLRKIEYTIDYTILNFSLDETKLYSDKNPEQFSERELFLLAQYYRPGSERYDELMLNTIPKLFPESSTAICNAAAVLIGKGNFDEAKRQLAPLTDNPQAWNNLGVIYMHEGDYEKAEDLFEFAQSAGITEAKLNLRELSKKLVDNAYPVRN